jgi:biopolymer transport protein ExbB
LDRLHHGRQAVQESMAAVTLLERHKGERFLTVLGTLGANAPFIGLLGTVVEIIHTLSNSGSMSAEKIPQMMADLSTALAATAVGLLVALPAVAANNYFRRRLQSMENASQAIGHELISYANLPHPEREA